MEPLALKRLSVIFVLLAGLVIMGVVPFPQSIQGPCYTAPAAIWSITRIGAGQIVTGWERNLLDSGGTRLLFQFERPDYVEVNIARELKDGAYVQKGDTIAVITSREGTGRLEVLSASLDKGYAEHEALLTGAREEDLEVARAEIIRARTALEVYKPELERVKALYDSGFASQSEWQVTKGQYELYAAELNLAEANLTALTAGARPADIAVAEDEIKILERSVKSGQRLLGQSEVIIAPISGYARLEGVDGTLIRIERMDTLAVFMSIPEASIPLIEQNTMINVKLKADSLPFRQCVLEQIYFSNTQQAGVYAIGLLENREGGLKAGMSGKGELSIGKRNLLAGFRAKFNI